MPRLRNWLIVPVLSFAIAWVGYTLLAYGVATVRGCNVTFKAIAWPGEWASSGGCNPDASIQPGGAGSNQFTPGTKPTTQVPLGNGKTTPASNLPGGPGNGVSP